VAARAQLIALTSFLLVRLDCTRSNTRKIAVIGMADLSACHVAHGVYRTARYLTIGFYDITPVDRVDELKRGHDATIEVRRKQLTPRPSSR